MLLVAQPHSMTSSARCRSIGGIDLRIRPDTWSGTAQALAPILEMCRSLVDNCGIAALLASSNTCEHVCEIWHQAAIDTFRRFVDIPQSRATTHDTKPRDADSDQIKGTRFWKSRDWRGQKAILTAAVRKTLDDFVVVIDADRLRTAH